MRVAKLGKLGMVVLVGLSKRSIKGATCGAMIGGRFGLLKSHPCFIVLRMVGVALDRIPRLRGRFVEVVTLTVSFGYRCVELLVRVPYGLLMSVLGRSHSLIERGGAVLI
jgi:hypothetical protein